MSFGAQGYLAFLALAAGAALMVVYSLRWRSRARARFGVGGHPSAGFVVVEVAAVAAIALAALGAARPQIGERATPVEDRGIDLVVVLDVSQSMLAQDAEPTRLGRAQAEVEALLDRLRGDRVGLVIFARRPFIRSPLTSDIDAVRRLVGGVDRETALVPPGSDLGAAILAARKSLASGEADTKAMLIVSDGEDHGDGVAAALAAARDDGIHIYTAGAGTARGAPVRVVDPATGAVTPRLDASGSPAVTRLDEGALRAMAQAGDGRYIALAGSGRSLASLAPELDDLASTLFASEDRSAPVERFQWFAAAALAFAGGGLLLAAASRLRAAARASRRLWPVAAASIFVGAICSTSVAEMNRAGNAQYARGDYAAAAAEYQRGIERDPAAAELHQNAGNAFDRSGDYDRAVEEAGRALSGDARGLDALVEYSIGNHHVGAGRLQEAREAYTRALLADPADNDAKHNLEIVDRLLQPTPTPEPRPTEPPPADDPGTANDGEGDSGEGTPGPGDQPAAGGQPRELSPEELERALAEALEGIDQEFTVEEALRALDLLAQQNRATATDPGGTAAPGSAPDW